jgi:hypothetical protein
MNNTLYIYKYDNSMKFRHKIRTEINNDFAKKKHNNFKGSKDKLHFIYYGTHIYDTKEKIKNKTIIHILS